MRKRTKARSTKRQSKFKCKKGQCGLVVKEDEIFMMSDHKFIISVNSNYIILRSVDNSL